MQPGTRDLGRSVITQIVGLPRSERIRALHEFFPQDELSRNEILSLLDLYDIDAPNRLSRAGTIPARLYIVVSMRYAVCVG